MSYIDTMKLGLEALEKYCTPYQDGTHPADEAITALREAIAEQPAQGCNYCNHALYSGTKCKNCGRVTEQAAIKRDLTPEQPAPVQQILSAFPLLDDEGLDEEKHHCEWTLQQDRKRLHAMLASAPHPAQRKPLHIGEETAAFKAWFDAWWVGDGEQGETIPTQSDKHFLTYVDQYTLGFGAWMAAKHAAHGIKEK